MSVQASQSHQRLHHASSALRIVSSVCLPCLILGKAAWDCRNRSKGPSQVPKPKDPKDPKETDERGIQHIQKRHQKAEAKLLKHLQTQTCSNMFQPCSVTFNSHAVRHGWGAASFAQVPPLVTLRDLLAIWPLTLGCLCTVMHLSCKPASSTTLPMQWDFPSLAPWVLHKMRKVVWATCFNVGRTV